MGQFCFLVSEAATVLMDKAFPAVYFNYASGLGKLNAGTFSNGQSFKSLRSTLGLCTKAISGHVK